ncbi:MAG: tetratricopeptide repeat protein [Bacteroidota bacterium]
MNIYKNSISEFLRQSKKVWIILFIVSLIGCGSKSDSDKLNFLKKGNIAYDNSEYNSALRYYNEGIKIDSTFVDIWNNKGLTLMKLERYDEAIYCFNKAISFKPEYGEALLNSARANLEVHQHFAALEQLERLSKVWPDTSLLPFTAGLIYADMGKNKEAIAEFKSALEKDSSNVETLVNLANLYYKSSELDTAIFCIERAMMLDASHPEAHNVLAMVYVEQEFYTDAYQTIMGAESLDSNPYILNNKGYILYKLNRLDEAEEAVEQSMKMDPYNVWVYRNLGLIKEAKGLMTDAVRLLEKAFSMNNSIENIHLDLARVQYNSGNAPRACEVLEMSNEAEADKLSSEWCD